MMNDNIKAIKLTIIEFYYQIAIVLFMVSFGLMFIPYTRMLAFCLMGTLLLSTVIFLIATLIELIIFTYKDNLKELDDD